MFFFVVVRSLNSIRKKESIIESKILNIIRMEVKEVHRLIGKSLAVNAIHFKWNIFIAKRERKQLNQLILVSVWPFHPLFILRPIHNIFFLVTLLFFPHFSLSLQIFLSCFYFSILWMYKTHCPANFCAFCNNDK